MRNRKGYSLIELLGALVIMGLILLVVIPLVSRLLISNDTKQYENYLKVIETGAKVYGDTRLDDLGTSGDTGCIEVTIEDLIKEEYIKKFDDKNITCNGKVRINNNNGKKKVSINITCVDEKNKETFKKENISVGTCIAYEPKDEQALINQMIKNGLGSGSSTSVFNNKTYIKGNNPNNYVWYSGKLWRVVWYDDEVVKLLSDDVITVMNKSNIKYFDSNVKTWLENTFLKTLKVDNYLIESNWNVDTNVKVMSSVGLLDASEVSRSDSFIKKDYTWMLSTYIDENIYVYNTNAQIITYDANTFYGIRPAITMKRDIHVTSGYGSKTHPYILVGNSTKIEKGTLLNKRFSGEYLKINDELYRIVNVEDGLTKVIMVNSLGEKPYDEENTNYEFSKSSLYDYLKNDWYENSLGEDKDLVYENGAWCSKTISGSIDFSNDCDSDSFAINSPVGIPTLGDIYTSNNDDNDSSFWTIDIYSKDKDNPKMNIISNNSKSSLSLSDESGVKPVMYLKENVIISSGKGTKTNPFILELK